MEHGWHSGAKRPLAIAGAVVLAYFGVEIAGALISGSLALLADAAHTVSDVGALGLAYAAAWIAGRPQSASHSFGLLRAEILSALVNGAALLVIATFIFIEAVQRFASPPEVKGGIVSLVASGGLVANLVAGWILMKASRESLNARSALFHVAGDAIGSAGAIVAGLAVMLFGWRLADPVVSVLIGLILVYGAVRVVRAATHILLEGTPTHIDVAELRRDIEALPMVAGVHDLHTWTITSGYEALSAHITIRDECEGAQVGALRGALGKVMRDKYNISHLTIQLERTAGECEEEVHVPSLDSREAPR